MNTYTHFTKTQRDQIAVWRAQQISMRTIAQRLGKSHSSISRELRRNRWQDTYVAIHAQEEAHKRICSARKRHPLKDASTYAYVIEKLRWGWSPEAIAGRLTLEQGASCIHYETIYRYIYALQTRYRRLWEYLARKQKKRKKHHGRTCHRSHIPNRVSIHHRPEDIENRITFGYWEGDSVVGLGKKEGIHTEVERKTRYLLARKVPRIGAQETVAA